MNNIHLGVEPFALPDWILVCSVFFSPHSPCRIILTLCISESMYKCIGADEAPKTIGIRNDSSDSLKIFDSPT